MSAAVQYLERHFDEGLAQLFELLRIPSISTDPGHAGDVQACAIVSDKLSEQKAAEVAVQFAIPTKLTLGPGGTTLDAWKADKSLQLDRSRLPKPDDFALLIFTLFSTVSQPMASTFSRHLEHQADVYGLEVIHGLVPDSEQAAARAFQKLGEKGLAYPSPHPLHVLWTFDHPPIGERVAFALAYRPWDEGEPLSYFER